MLEETLHAANWWVERIRSYKIVLAHPSWLLHFEKVFTELLRAKYQGHWYLANPLRGSGYRAISNEYGLDPIVERAAKAVSHSLPKKLAKSVLKSNDRWLVMFVNPGRVSIRDRQYREFVIYDSKKNIFNKTISKKSKSSNALHTHSLSQSENVGTIAAVNTTPNSSQSQATNQIVIESKLDPNPKVVKNVSSKKVSVAVAAAAEQKKGEKGKEIVDYRQIFLRDIHMAALREKEKEILEHVEIFKEEMRLLHYKHRAKFAPYDGKGPQWTDPKLSSHSSQSNTETAAKTSSSLSGISGGMGVGQSNANSLTQQQQPNQKQKQKKNVFELISGRKRFSTHDPSEYHPANGKDSVFIDPDSNHGKHLKMILDSIKKRESQMNSNAKQNAKEKENKSEKKKKEKESENGNQWRREGSFLVHPFAMPVSLAYPSPSSPSTSPSPVCSSTVKHTEQKSKRIKSKDFELAIEESSADEEIQHIH